MTCNFRFPGPPSSPQFNEEQGRGVSVGHKFAFRPVAAVDLRQIYLICFRIRWLWQGRGLSRLH